jgi:ATP-binding cassette subfamily C protein
MRFGSSIKAILGLSKNGFRLLSQSGKKTLVFYSISLSVIGILDGIGLGLLAHALSIASESNFFGSDKLVLLLFLVVVLFIVKSILALWITNICLQSLALEEVAVGQRSFKNLSAADWIDFRRLQLSDFYLHIDRSPNALVQNYLFLNATIFAEIANVIIVVVLLVVVSPVTAIVTGLYFAAVSVVQHFALSRSSSRSGEIVAKEFNSVYSILSEYFQFGKLLRVMPSSSLEESLLKSRLALAQARATAAFLASVPRYFLEAVLAFGCLLIFGAAYFQDGATAVVPALAIFAGAGFRLLPMVNKIQGLILVLFSSYPLAISAISDVKIGRKEVEKDETSSVDSDDDVLLQLRSVDYSYPDSINPVLKGINLDIKTGLQYAIVGESGSGKTTLTEIVVGLIHPTSGERLLSAQCKIEFGYVPQDNPIFSGTIEQNISMSWLPTSYDAKRMNDAVQKTQLEEVIADYESRISDIEDSQLFLSGGQRQRMGIARALYRDANFLILDEPTSALDAELEFKLVEMLNNLKPDITTITVAHRLSTIQAADVIIYLENGSIAALGSFVDLFNTSPGFKRMVELSSLKTVKTTDVF